MFRKTACAMTLMTRNHLFHRLPVNIFATRSQTTLTDACPVKIAKAKEKNFNAAQLLQRKYPHVLIYNEPGQIAYAVRGESPEELIAAGGFYSRSDIWFANNGNGMNKGSVCFSLLPEVTIIFLSHALKVSNQNKAFLYAVSLHGNLFLPGGPFCQIISPGAFALPSFWVAREVMSINHNEQIHLGPMLGHVDEITTGINGTRFQEYYENKLQKPAADFSFGEDYEPHFDIKHTTESMMLQERVRRHY